MNGGSSYQWEWAGDPADNPHRYDPPPASPIVTLGSIDGTPPPPMLLDRLDPEGHTILYGPGGVGKGALAAEWIGQLVGIGHKVLVLDYEHHPGEWRRRIDSLAPDSVAGVWYVEPSASLGDLHIGEDIKRLGITYVVVDSAIMACGADPLRPEAAMQYGQGVIRLARPVLTLAHVTKVDDARYPFGSVFWHNLARTTWSLTPDGDSAKLTHRKANNYAKVSPLAVTMTWRDDALREVWERPAVASLGDEIAVLLEACALSVPQIVDALSTDDRTVSRFSVTAALKRGTGLMGRFSVHTSDGVRVWSLSA